LFCTCLISWAAGPWLNGPSKRSLPYTVSTVFFLSQAAIFSSSSEPAPFTPASRICHSETMPQA